jgi:hypothetical protein
LDGAKQALVAEVLNIQLMTLRNECGPISSPEWDEVARVLHVLKTFTERVISRCPCIDVCGEDADAAASGE